MNASRLRIEYLPLAELKPYDRNARTHSAEQVAQIAASMRAFGWTNPILVDEHGVIIAGHGRLAAALELGLTEAPVIRIAGLDEAQRRALTLADNKLALNAGWDEALLAAELQGLGGDLQGLVGFSGDELLRLLGNRQGLTDPDDAPPAPAHPVSQPGDVWLCGPHRLVCGDATCAGDVALALAGTAPHLMVTDPPYGVDYEAGWRGDAGLSGKAGLARGAVLNDDRADWRAAWALFPGHVAYVWHGGLHAALATQALAAVGLGVRAQIVWVKTRPVIGRGNYHWQHEPLLYAVRPDADDNWRFVPEHELAAYVVKTGHRADYAGDRKQSTVWFIEHLKSDTGHSTQKPVECMRRPLINNSRVGDHVYDPFLGSGTTLIAAEITDRICHALELAPAYCDVAVTRWENFTGRKAERATGGGMRRVILESPYAGNLWTRWINRRYARAAMRDCLSRGEAPIASHLLYTQILDDGDPHDRELGIRAGLNWLAVAEASVVYVDRGVSSGMQKGIKAAKLAGVPVEQRSIAWH